VADRFAAVNRFRSRLRRAQQSAQPVLQSRRRRVRDRLDVDECAVRGRCGTARPGRTRRSGCGAATRHGAALPVAIARCRRAYGRP
jgi:hypothetical protein